MHTPYDGSSKLFQIGLKPLDLEDWIDVDDRLAAYLDEKDRLWAAHPDEVFVAEAGTEDAQAEVLELLVEHLPARFPERLSAQRRHDRDRAGRRTVDLGRRRRRCWTAARLVQEDLVLMRNGETGWRLAAASLSFPSSWRLARKVRAADARGARAGARLRRRHAQRRADRADVRPSAAARSR